MMLTQSQPAVKKVPGRIGELVKFPLQRIHIELTNVCNFDCTFCPKSEMTRKYGYMDYGRATAIIDEIAEYGMAEKITFHVMGEPFMHPRFLDILEHAAAAGVKTGITTNGTYLDATAAAKLEKVKVAQMNISLQTPDEESFKTRKSRTLDFAEYKRRILEFIAASQRHATTPALKIHFLNTAIPADVPGEDGGLGGMNVIANTRELRRVFAYWAAEVRNILPPAAPEKAAEIDARIARLSAFKWNVVNVAPNVHFETYLLDTWGNAFTDGDRVVPSRYGYCSGLSDHFAIQHNGDLIYCCRDFDGKTAAGNVSKDGIVAVLNSAPVIAAVEGFAKLRVAHPHCQRCLGGKTWLRSLGNQIGSIVIWKYLKNFFYKKT